MEALLSSFKLLKDFKIANFVIIEKIEDLEKLTFPYYMKIDSYEHKLKQGGVVFIEDFKSAKENFKILKEKFNEKKIVIQEKVDGIELIVGVKYDLVFGKVLAVGFGGSNVESERDVSFRVLRLGRNEVVKMLNELEDAEKLNRHPAKEKFISFVEMIAYFVDKLDIKEMDLNPVFLTNKGPVIVDARIEI